MKLPISSRGVVRIVCFGVAVTVCLGVYAVDVTKQNRTVQAQLQSQQHRTVAQWADVVANIKTTLQEMLYSEDKTMLVSHFAKLQEKVAATKRCVSSLSTPTAPSLTQVYLFLKQVDTVSNRLTRTLAGGGTLTLQQRTTLAEMLKDTDLLLEAVLISQDLMKTHEITLEDAIVAFAFEPQTVIEVNTLPAQNSLQEGYLLQNLPPVSSDQALRTAKNIDDKVLLTQESTQPFESYLFQHEDTVIRVSKKGGELLKLLRNRPVLSASIPLEQAVEIARDFALAYAKKPLQKLKQRQDGNVMSIWFAPKQQDILLECDAILVQIALDDGEILCYDAVEYFTHHHLRTELVAVLLPEQAANLLYRGLTPMQTNLSLILTPQQEEVLCYQFVCKADDGQTIIVYLDAKNGTQQRLNVAVT